MFNFFFQGKVGEMIAPIKSPEAQLLIAIQNRQHDKIRELLEVQGVGANDANDRGVRPMHMACQSGDMQLVQRLLELGADIITADDAGNTPLHYAAKHGRTDLVKMLVGQGAGPEKRNGHRQTPYDVARDHVVRQFLLPLQLKAEAGNADYAVHDMGITSDVPRNYEQYGTPAMSMGSSYGQQPFGGGGHPFGGSSSGGSDPMSAALGALMQPAPSMPNAPRPGATGAPPPPPPAAAGGIGMLGGTPARPAGSVSSPEGSGYPVGGFNVPPPMASTSPSAVSAPTVPLPTPRNTVGLARPNSQSGSSSPPPPSAPFPGATQPVAPQTNEEESAAAGPTSTAGAGTPSVSEGSAPSGESATSPPSFSGVAVQVTHVGTVEGAGEGFSAGLPVSASKSGTSAPGEDHSTSSEVVAGRERSKASSPSAVGVSATTAETQKEVGGMAVEPPRPGAFAFTGSASGSRSPLGKNDGSPAMTAVDLSSRFQAQAALSSPPQASSGVPPPPHGLPHVLSAPSSFQTPPPPPVQTSSQRQKPTRTVEQPGKPKLIKPDGFHSSASDKALQLRYGHTQIVRDMGAPPTHAQLGSGPGGLASSWGGPPAGGPPQYGGGGYGHAQQLPPMGTGGAGPPPAGQYLPQPGHYGQPLGGGGQKSFGQPFTAQRQQQQPHNQYAPSPPPIPPAVQTDGVAHAGLGGQRAFPANSLGQGALPTPSGYSTLPTPGSGGAQPTPPAAGAPQRGYSAFNPTTDRVVSADSTSSAVL